MILPECNHLELAKRCSCLYQHLPSEVILQNVQNANTLTKLHNTPSQNLKNDFNNTIHGRRVMYLFSDFGLEIKNIIIKQIIASRLDIIITTNIIL